jgi:GT2 family glycosyltransferase
MKDGPRSRGDGALPNRGAEDGEMGATLLNVADAEAGPPVIVFSLVILTYARDEVLRQCLDAIARGLGDSRRDYEVVLVDNNVDAVDRGAWLARFPASQYVRMAENRGVVARNDGMDLARGEILIVLDDDVIVQTEGFVDRFAERFAADPQLGVVTVRKLDHRTQTVRLDAIPHTRKTIDTTRPFPTFRFIGGCVAFRARLHREVGGFSPEFFWGLEEIEYSYRVLEAGWRILYVPDVVVVELEHPAGRRPRREIETQVLTNKFIMSYIHMPFPHVLVNFVGYPLHYRLSGGRASVTGAMAAFLRWLRRSDRPVRRPIGRNARAYIKACGGHLWR